MLSGSNRTTGNTAWWGDPEGRSENFSRGAEGYQIESARFEDLLLELARHAGVLANRLPATRRSIRPRMLTGDRFLLVGDAVSAIDPLSSFGVKKALASGWMAAAVTNTSLRNEAMRGPALELYDRREREAYSSYSSPCRTVLS